MTDIDKIFMIFGVSILWRIKGRDKEERKEEPVERTCIEEPSHTMTELLVFELVTEWSIPADEAR